MKYEPIFVKGTGEVYLIGIPEVATDDEMLLCDKIILQLLDHIKHLENEQRHPIKLVTGGDKEDTGYYS